MSVRVFLGSLALVLVACDPADNGVSDADSDPQVPDTVDSDQPDSPAPTFEIERLEVRHVNPGDLWVWWTATQADTCALRVSSGSRAREVTGLLGGEAPGALHLNFSSEPGVDALDVVLSCTGAAGVGVLASHVDDHGPVRITDRWNDPLTVAASGGRVDLCWEAADADSCTLYSQEPEVLLDGSGCHPVDVPAGGAYEALLGCRGGDSSVAEFVSLAAGYGLALRAEPAYLDAPGEVTLSWSTAGAAETCSLTDDAGASIAAGAQGSATVRVAVDSTFKFSCIDENGFENIRFREVKVGPRVTTFQTLGLSPEKQNIGVLWQTEGFDRCALTLDNDNDQVTLDNLAPNVAASSEFPELSSWLTLYTNLEGAGETTITFQCDGPLGPSETTTVTLPEPGFVELLSFEALPDALPAGGGAVDVCWDARFATSCELAIVNDTSAQSYLGLGTACLSDLPGAQRDITEASEARLQCYGAFDSVYAVREISVGPTIRLFESDTDALEVPGPVTVSWDAVEVSGCELLADDGSVLGEGTSSAGTPITLSATTTLTLRCLGLDGDTLEQDLRVGVGPAILALGARAENALAVTAWVRTTPFVDDCELYFDREDGWRYSQFGVVVGGFWPDLATATWQWDFGVYGPLVVTAMCNSAAGVIRESITVLPPPDPIPRGLSLEVSPEHAPVGPATFHACWAFADADRCDATTSDSGQVFNDVGTTGCLDVTVNDDELLTLACSNPVSEQIGNRLVSRLLQVGPSVIALSATPNVLFLDEGPAVTTLAWETYDMVSCTLETPSGQRAVPVTGSFTETLLSAGLVTPALRCLDAQGVEVAYLVEIGVWPRR